MLLQIPTFTGGTITRFDRGIKQFETISDISNWTDIEKISMLTTKISDKAYDIVQNMLKSQPGSHSILKAILHESFHGSKTTDYCQNRFDSIERKPQESILDYAFRLETFVQRAYPMESGDEDNTSERSYPLM